MWTTVAPASQAELIAARTAFLKEPNLVHHAWDKGPSEYSGTTAQGDITWSDAKQSGFMRFRGLPLNDPKKFQYQLWIFDSERDSSKPTSGGVFDVLSCDGEYLVEIAPSIAVFEGKSFVVTVEPPGGVVVSKRKHIVRTANL